MAHGQYFKAALEHDIWQVCPTGGSLSFPEQLRGRRELHAGSIARQHWSTTSVMFAYLDALWVPQSSRVAERGESPPCA
eukprot:2089873-Alexandrium_andersonii.AAC.1